MIDKLTEADLQGTRARQGGVVDMKSSLSKADLALMIKLNLVIDRINAIHP